MIHEPTEQRDRQAASLCALNFLAHEQLAQKSDMQVDCGREGCDLCSKSAQRVFGLADSLSAISSVAALCRFVKPGWNALDWCLNRQTQPHPAFNPHCALQGIRSLRRSNSSVRSSRPVVRQAITRPEIPPLSLAPPGYPKAMPPGECTAIKKQSSSTGQLERCVYRRRSASSPLASDVIVLKKK